MRRSKDRFLVVIAQRLLGFVVVATGSTWLSTHNPRALSMVLLATFILGLLGSIGLLIYQRFFPALEPGGRVHPAPLILIALSALLLAAVTASEATGILLPMAEVLFAVGIGLLLIGTSCCSCPCAERRTPKQMVQRPGAPRSASVRRELDVAVLEVAKELLQQRVPAA
jgi:hypothetical protein